ncbi:pyridoxal phosphate-dependent aminotransferase [Nocardia sp. NPDC005998]|uniref:pyridoxal phosphate-dependent aminotransferase n=1 Tax=Nocardia sp. NPDC005998 TaxID=3156894 RepID=UPI0033BA9C05
MLKRLPAMVLSERVEQQSGAGADLVAVRGVPTVPMPPHVAAAAYQAAGKVFPRRSRGALDLRAAIAEKLMSTFGLAVEPETDLLVSHGAQHGMSIALRALLRPGDEVIVPAPTYFFDGIIQLAGARPRYVMTAAEAGWRIDVEQVESAVTDRTRAILVCNPNNPTGDVPSAECLAGLAAVARRHGLYVFADESYERYVHDGPGYIPLMSLAERGDKFVTVTSLSKNYAFTGWRIGYIHSTPGLINEIHTAFEWEAINVGDVPQAAAVAAITGPQAWLEKEFSTMRARREILLEALARAGVPAVRPSAGVFVFADFTVTGRHGAGLEEFLLEAGIPALAGDGFAGPGTHARLLYGADMDDVRALGERIGSVLAGLSSHR